MNSSLALSSVPSVTHQSIRHASLMMAPFYEILPAGFSDDGRDALLEGERNLYRFMTDLYADMYAHPEAYDIPVGEYEEYMQGKTRRDLPHKGDPKESRLRNRFQQAIQFYQKLLFEIGSKAAPEGLGERLMLDASFLPGMINEYNLRLIRGQEKLRIAHLARLGLEIGISNGMATVSNQHYSNMLTALTALCKGKSGKYALTHLLRCDFRGLQGYKPVFTDTISILPEDFATMAVEMDNLMMDIDAKISVQPLKNTTLYSPWKVLFNRNGKSVFGFHADTDGWENYVYFNHFSNVSRMGYLLKEDSPTLYEWFNDRFPTRSCSCPNNRLADIGGCKKRICGLMNRLEIRNPNWEDLENLKRVVKISLEKIWVEEKFKNSMSTKEEA